MIKNSTLIHDLTSEQLATLFSDIQNQLSDLKQNFQPKVPEEYITRKELADLLKCDLSTLYNWVKKGKLKTYGLGNRIWFKRSEIEAALLPLNEKKGNSHE